MGLLEVYQNAWQSFDEGLAGFTPQPHQPDQLLQPYTGFLNALAKLNGHEKAIPTAYMRHFPEAVIQVAGLVAPSSYRMPGKTDLGLYFARIEHLPAYPQNAEYYASVIPFSSETADYSPFPLQEKISKFFIEKLLSQYAWKVFDPQRHPIDMNLSVLKRAVQYGLIPTLTLHSL